MKKIVLLTLSLFFNASIFAAQKATNSPMRQEPFENQSISNLIDSLTTECDQLINQDNTNDRVIAILERIHSLLKNNTELSKKIKSNNTIKLKLLFVMHRAMLFNMLDLANLLFTFNLPINERIISLGHQNYGSLLHMVCITDFIQPEMVYSVEQVKRKAAWARLLLRYNANLNLRSLKEKENKDCTNYTPLQLAVKHDYNEELIKLLIQHKAHVNSVHEEDNFPLVCASRLNPPIFFAIKSRQAYYVNILLFAGAHLQTKLSNGLTPSKFAEDTCYRFFNEDPRDTDDNSKFQHIMNFLLYPAKTLRDTFLAPEADEFIDVNSPLTPTTVKTNIFQQLRAREIGQKKTKTWKRRSKL